MRNKQKGFSLIELLIVVAIILIIAAIAIPNLLRSKMAANEASAVGSLRTINTAAISYSSTYGVGFPTALSQLGPVASGSATSSSADLIDGVLATGTKSGYSFGITAPGTTPSGVTGQTYDALATPITQNVSGSRGFYTNQTAVIRQHIGAPAVIGDPPIGQ
jgi:prepilin-type N-terminal cleavage/methylation domain-containing protein